MNYPDNFPQRKEGNRAMGMDANLFVTKYVRHGEYTEDAEGRMEYIENPQYKEVAKQFGLDKVVASQDTIQVRIPVSYFRKDYDLHTWIAKSKGIEFDDIGGSAWLSLDDVKKALNFVLTYEGYDKNKRIDAAMNLRMAIASGEDYFQYSAG